MINKIRYMNDEEKIEFLIKQERLRIIELLELEISNNIEPYNYTANIVLSELRRFNVWPYL